MSLSSPSPPPPSSSSSAPSSSSSSSDGAVRARRLPTTMATTTTTAALLPTTTAAASSAPTSTATSKKAADAEAADVAARQARCEHWLQTALDTNPWVGHLLNTLAAKGCVAAADVHEFFVCRPCTEDSEGYFDSERVVVCSNHCRSSRALEETVLHEGVHAWDLCTTHFDGASLAHRACTEIRAANLSGECRWLSERLRGAPSAFLQGQQKCVRRRAAVSLRASGVSPQQADEAVARVWRACYEDQSPFTGYVPPPTRQHTTTTSVSTTSGGSD